MKTTTESDIPQLFRQFSGNAANYQELTRAAAARASQARWPLLSAVELERGDIPAVIDRETGLVVLEAKLPQAKTTLAGSAADDAAAAPFMVLADITPDTAPTTSETIALANAEGVSLSKDEILALIDIEAQDAPETPVPVILPGTNTIFMAPATFGARHFAQVERALAARREAALFGTPAPSDAADAPLTADAAVDVDVDVEHLPATAVASSDAADETLAALSAELDASLSREAAAPAMELAEADTPQALTRTHTVATESVTVESTISAASAPQTPSVVETTPSNPVKPVVVPRQPTTSPISAPAPVSAAHASLARPVSNPLSQVAASIAAPSPLKPATQTPVQTAARSAVALPAPDVRSPVKHAGLKPLFERLAAPEETASPVMSLFSRLLQS